MIETRRTVLRCKPVSPLDALCLRDVPDGIGLQIRPGFEERVQALFVVRLRFRFVIRRCLDPFQIDFGGGLKSNSWIAARGQQRLLLLNLLNLVGQPLCGDAQNIGLQAAPNQLAVVPQSDKVFSG